ncbi:MAG: hypothetical protein U5N55_11755 [Cypionkella sp.]|nr:hypothetical protein [Cypionkella sp.]
MPEVIVPDHSEPIIRTLDFYEPMGINRSDWTGVRKSIGRPGAGFWRGQIAVADIATELEERQWRAFTARLRGTQNWFKVYLPCQSHIGPAPTVAAGATNGYSLPLTGMSPSTLILYAGQHITVPLPSGHSRAVRLTDHLVTDSSGNATASFSPALNEVPALAATVETARPFVAVTASQPDNPFEQEDGVSRFQMDIEESIGAY